MSLTVTTRGGSSPWDGIHRFTIEGDLPSSVAPHEVARVTQEHWETLRQDLDAEMAAWASH